MDSALLLLAATAILQAPGLSFSHVSLKLFLVLLLIAANGFFVAAEFSLVSIRDTRIQQLIEAHRVGARLVQRLHRNFDQVLLGVQLGVTLASLALGWLGEPTIEGLIEPLFAAFRMRPSTLTRSRRPWPSRSSPTCTLFWGRSSPSLLRCTAQSASPLR